MPSVSELLNAGRLEEARSLGLRLMHERASDPAGWLGLAAVERLSGNFALARDHARKAESLGARAAALHELGACAAGEGGIEEARSLFVEAARLDGRFLPALNHLGNALCDQGLLEEGVSCYRAALAVDPASAEFWNNLGIALAQQQRSEEAMTAWREALKHKPDHVSAWNNLGLALASQKQYSEAVECYRRALSIKPDYPKAAFNLGLALGAQHLYGEAAAAFERAVELNPGWLEAALQAAAHFEAAGLFPRAEALARAALALDSTRPGAARALGRLARALEGQGRFEEALTTCEQALAGNPGDAALHRHCARLLQKGGRLDSAIEHFERAVALDPRDSAAWNGLGVASYGRNRFDRAAECYRKALALSPALVSVHVDLALALWKGGDAAGAEQAAREALRLAPGDAAILANAAFVLHAVGRRSEAIVTYRHALALDPAHIGAWSNLGLALTEGGAHREAERCYREALRRDPHSAEARLNLGTLLLTENRIEDSVAELRALLRERPDHADAQSNLLYALNYLDSASAAEIFEEHRRWGESFERTVTPLPGEPRGSGALAANSHDRDPERKLRIGYVSPDFRTHSVTFFLEPVFAHCDRARFEIYCYSELERAQHDAVTQRLKAAASSWVDTLGMSDAELAARILQDRIDILVDLGGHSAHGRVRALAFRPAPVQMSWLGYINTTGLPAVQYRLTDTFADPVGHENIHTEQLVRLPRAFYCYQPPEMAPPVGPLPARAAGHITFASFNNYAKHGRRTLAAWAEILRRVPGSRLLIQTSAFSDTELRDELHAFFRERGIEPQRLELRGNAPPAEYLARHNTVDILLDTFPHAGHTVTCHALWMGVPFVTLTGDRYAGRLGVSVLSNLGLSELIAESVEAYIKTAVDLARDLDRLAQLRAGLRERLAASGLCDGARFTRELEELWLKLWSRCGTTPPAVHSRST